MPCNVKFRTKELLHNQMNKANEQSKKNVCSNYVDSESVAIGMRITVEGWPH